MSTIRECRKKHGLSQKALAELCHVDQTSVSKWELGKSFPDVPVAIQLSSYFGVSLDSIYENPITFGSVYLPVHRHLLPELLTVKPAFSEEYLEIGAGNLSRYFTRAELSAANSVREQLDEHFFALAVTGKTMEARFVEGDTVLVKKQPHVDNNQIAVVCVDSEEARLYQIKWHRKGIVLHSLNTSFEPVFYTKSELDAGNIRILGLVVELMGKTL